MIYSKVLETGRSISIRRKDGELVVIHVVPASVEQETTDLRQTLQYVRELLEANFGS